MIFVFRFIEVIKLSSENYKVFHNLMQMTAITESVQGGPTEREDITFDFFSFLLHMVLPRLMRIVIILKILLTSCGSN